MTTDAFLARPRHARVSGQGFAASLRRRLQGALCFVQGRVGVGYLVAATLMTVGAGIAAETPVPRKPWSMSLVAEAPRLRFPSVVACAPDGRVFVAEDPMDITRPANVAEGRILCLHPDGRITVFAEALHAVFGMQYLEGRLYVLHNPRFSVFRDDQGVGRDRVELIEQTNPNPWALDWNDHVPANFKLGMDGRFYVAIGDKGLFRAVGRDGSRVDLHGGGILRLRPDGTELEVFSTGVRNILDVALTDEDEVFTYDNTDENQWMGRVTHMVDGGFYGYPFDFIPQRPYTLWMMADYGAGAATGALCLTDDVLPEAWRCNLLLADFGQRNLRRVAIARVGGTFKPLMDELVFPNPPGDFRPVGIAASDDGRSIYICDWQHRDSKEQASVGRLWKLSWEGATEGRRRPEWYVDAAMGRTVNPTRDSMVEALGHPARSVRMTAQRQWAVGGKDNLPVLLNVLKSPSSSSLARVHALWAMDAIDGGSAARATVRAAVGASDLRVARQAARQLGNRRVSEAVPELIDALAHADASMRFQAATALGRIADPRSISMLTAGLADADLFARHATFRALQRMGQARDATWDEILGAFVHENPRVREGARFVVRGVVSEPLVRALNGWLAKPQTAGNLPVLTSFLEVLGGLVGIEPAWNGEWWAYHPFRLPPPARTNEWAGTPSVLKTFEPWLMDARPAVRAAAIRALSISGAPAAGRRLLSLAEGEREVSVRREILRGLASTKIEGLAAFCARELESVGADESLDVELAALARSAGGTSVEAALQRWTEAPSDTRAVRALECLAAVGGSQSLAVYERSLASEAEAKKRAAVQGLSKMGGTAAAKALASAAAAPGVSLDFARFALESLAPLRERGVIDDLLKLADRADLRDAVARALAESPDARAMELYVEALGSKQAALRGLCRAALGKIRDEAWPRLEPRLKTFSPEVVAELQAVYRGHVGAEKGGLFALDARRPDREAFLAFGLANPGRADRGRLLFQDKAGVACVNCHRVSGVGGDVGPDLSGVGAQFDRRALAESVLLPSKVVREGYQVVELELSSGEELSGMVRSESAAVVVLQPAVGNAVEVAKSRIKTRRPTALSLMPEGLEAGLSLEDFADLLAYLESLRSGS